MTPEAEAERDTGILTPTIIVGTWLSAAAFMPTEHPLQVMAAGPVAGLQLCLPFATNAGFVLLQGCTCPPPPDALPRTDKVTFLFSFKATDSEAFSADWQKTRHSPGSCKWKIHPPPPVPPKSVEEENPRK